VWVVGLWVGANEEWDAQRGCSARGGVAGRRRHVKMASIAGRGLSTFPQGLQGEQRGLGPWEARGVEGNREEPSQPLARHGCRSHVLGSSCRQCAGSLRCVCLDDDTMRTSLVQMVRAQMPVQDVLAESGPHSSVRGPHLAEACSMGVGACATHGTPPVCAAHMPPPIPGQPLQEWCFFEVHAMWVRAAALKHVGAAMRCAPQSCQGMN